MQPTMTVAGSALGTKGDDEVKVLVRVRAPFMVDLRTVRATMGLTCSCWISYASTRLPSWLVDARGGSNMRRRDLLVGGMSVTGALLARSAYSQLVKRAAVVVGVDRVGDLTPLRGAASGAREVAAWLRAEGFEVKLFEDSQGPVTVNSLITAITELVRRGNLEQLVIYFAGHGFVSSYSSELWMLSDARSNYNEAISLNECRETSRQFGIKNVVFISDACRSRAETLQTGSVKGSIIFPPPQSGRGGVATEVDKFLATRIGDPAWEISVAATSKASQGIYTACLLEAFRRPSNAMVQLVDGTPVVPNRRLKGYLANEVPKRAQTVSIQLSQTPDAEVCSDEPTYIGHVSTADRQS